MLLYILGLGSPTHPLPESSYAAWASTYEWIHSYGLDYLYAGPLFTHQLSHIWIDFRGIRDAFMRVKGIDYFENSRRASTVQHRYAIDNPHKFVGYREGCWGFTASDGPGPDSRKVDGVVRRFYGYIGRGAPFGPDDGTIAPWAAVASLPFAPDIVLPLINYYVYQLKLKNNHPYGFKATFNLTHPDRSTNPFGWRSPWHYGLNQGPIILMIENHRSGLLWQWIAPISLPVCSARVLAGDGFDCRSVSIFLEHFLWAISPAPPCQKAGCGPSLSRTPLAGANNRTGNLRLKSRVTGQQTHRWGIRLSFRFDFSSCPRLCSVAIGVPDMNNIQGDMQDEKNHDSRSAAAGGRVCPGRQ